MGKRVQWTPSSIIRSALRKCWLKSRERSFTLRRDKYTCQHCKRKASKAKGREFSVEVHHKDGIPGWEHVIEVIREYILVDPSRLETICRECHGKEHENV